MERVSVTVLDADDRREVAAWVLPLLGVLRDREHVLSTVRGVEDPGLLWTDDRLGVLAGVCARLAARLHAVVTAHDMPGFGLTQRRAMPAAPALLRCLLHRDPAAASRRLGHALPKRSGPCGWPARIQTLCWPMPRVPAGRLCPAGASVHTSSPSLPSLQVPSWPPLFGGDELRRHAGHPVGSGAPRGAGGGSGGHRSEARAHRAQPGWGGGGRCRDCSTPGGRAPQARCFAHLQCRTVRWAQAAPAQRAGMCPLPHMQGLACPLDPCPPASPPLGRTLPRSCWWPPACWPGVPRPRPARYPTASAGPCPFGRGAASRVNQRAVGAQQHTAAPGCAAAVAASVVAAVASCPRALPCRPTARWDGSKARRAGASRRGRPRRRAPAPTDAPTRRPAGGGWLACFQ